MIMRKAKGDKIMYICIKTNENMDLLVKTLLAANISIDVSRHSNLSWIRADLKAAGFLSYVAVYSKELVIHNKDYNDNTVLAKISFEDLETIYELD